jgi:hypothetical protein
MDRGVAEWFVSTTAKVDPPFGSEAAGYIRQTKASPKCAEPRPFRLIRVWRARGEQRQAGYALGTSGCQRSEDLPGTRAFGFFLILRTRGASANGERSEGLARSLN